MQQHAIAMNPEPRLTDISQGIHCDLGNTVLEALTLTLLSQTSWPFAVSVHQDQTT